MDSENNNRADQWLDEALKQYGQAEPRAGLEGRVVANLRNQAHSVALGRQGWIIRTAAFAGLAAVAAIFLVLGNDRAKLQVVIRDQAPTTMASSAHLDQVSTSTRKAVLESQFHHAKAMLLTAKNEIEPPLAQFPVPRPLTSQEQLLVRYVQESPGEAKHQARAQTELFQQDLAEFKKPFEILERHPTQNLN